MTSRRASVADASAICDIVRRSIVELCVEDHANDPDVIGKWLANKTPATVATWIESADNVTIVAESAGSIVGCGLLKADGRLLLFYVSPDARFQGVSKLLMRAIEAEAATLALTEITLDSTTTARRFYLNCGFTEESASEPRPGVVRSIPMSRTVT